MSERDLETLQQAVDAFNRRDLAALRELTSSDFVFIPYLATLIEQTVYRGHEGLDRYLEDAEAAWGRIRASLDEVREVSDGVVYASGELFGEARASHLEVRLPLAWVIHFRQGKLTQLESYRNQADAMSAAGLEE